MRTRRRDTPRTCASMPGTEQLRPRSFAAARAGTSRTIATTTKEREQTGNRRQPENGSQRRMPDREHRERDQRAEHRARVVRGRVKAERSPSNRRIHRLRDQRVARRAPDPLADSIGHANREHLAGRLRERGQRPHERRDAVAEHDERLSRFRPVRPPPARELEQRRDRLGRAFDRADEARARTEHRREKYRHERIHHLGRDVGEKAHRADRDDVATELCWVARPSIQKGERFDSPSLREVFASRHAT